MEMSCIRFTTLSLTVIAGCAGCRSAPPERLFANAEQLQQRYEKEASRQALSRYQEALDGWARRGDARQAAVAGQRIGEVQEQLGLPQESLRAYREALILAQKSGDAALESQIRSDIGTAQCLVAGGAELIEAQRHCETARTMARQSGAAIAEAKALNCLGEVEYHRGDLGRSLEFYGAAATLWSRVGDARGRAKTHLFQGWAYSDLSRFDEAEHSFDSAESLWRAIGDRRWQAITLVADARLRQRRADYQEALNRFNAALELLQPMGDLIWEGATLTGLGAVYRQMADNSAALKLWERALALYETAGEKDGSADVLLSLGATYLASGDTTAALNRFERALTLAQERGNDRLRAFALNQVGVVHLSRNRPLEAQRQLLRSLEVQRGMGGAGDPRLEAATRSAIGEVYSSLGRHDDAIRAFSDALSLSRSGVDRVREASALFGLARSSDAANDSARARRYIESSLAVVEALRTEVESRDLRASFFASVQQYHQLHMDVLMQLHRRDPRNGLAAEAFHASERARARSLLDSLITAGVDLRAGADPALLGREQALKNSFDDWATRQRQATAALPNPAGQALVEEYRELELRYSQVQSELRSRNPRYAALVRPRPLTLQQVQQQILDADTLLLEYALGEKRSFLWAVSHTKYDTFELPPRAVIERAAGRVYDLLTMRLRLTTDTRDRRQQIELADAEYGREASNLSEMLLGPVVRAITGKRILVVADAALQSLPFAALPVPRRAEQTPLIAEHEVVNLPSASVLALLRRSGAGKRPVRTVAVLADPVFESDDPRLRDAAAADRRDRSKAAAGSTANAGGAATLTASRSSRNGGGTFPRLAATRQEAEAIVAAAGDKVTLKALDFDANRITALGPAMAKYDIVHFATHGVFDNEDPGRSGIVLSLFDSRGQPQDGFLRLHDIYGMQLASQLVVLSACDTALGKPVKGEGLIGIVRGFMYAGAQRIVASHWKVDDEATGELMRLFYGEMLGRNRSAAAALRDAQLALSKQQRWRAPFYWAAFVLQGEWQ